MVRVTGGMVLEVVGDFGDGLEANSGGDGDDGDDDEQEEGFDQGQGTRT
jgi:hypothetical protein